MVISLKEEKDWFVAQHSGEYPVLAMSKGIVKHTGNRKPAAGTRRFDCQNCLI